MSELRKDQMIPSGNWRTFLLLADPGWGKSLALMYWLCSRALTNHNCNAAFVTEIPQFIENTIIDVADFLSEKFHWNRSLSQITFRNQSRIWVFDSHAPERMRGIQLHFAACDELNRWGIQGDRTYADVQFATRLGGAPRILAAATPTPITPLVARVIADPRTYVIKPNREPNPMLTELAIKSQMGANEYGA